jgi:S1-C subfamily serine protease
LRQADVATGQVRAAIVSGVASALVVCAIFLAAGAFDDGEGGGEGDRARSGGAVTPPAPVASVGGVYRRVRLGVVLVDHRPPGVAPRTGPPRRDDRVATGSGFVIDDAGHVVTNQHVVAGRGTTTVQLDDDEDPVKATIVGRDASTDLALVRIDRPDARRLTPLALGASAAVRVGDPAIAIGNPLGLERTLTVGVVSATDRTINAPDRSKIKDAVQTDAPINVGNSGGPLLDARGRVIGVISQGRGNGIAFAVPVDTVRRVVADLRRDGRARRARPR